MTYSITFTEELYNTIISHLFIDRLQERAGYILCGQSETSDEIRLLAREFIPVSNEEVHSASTQHMSIKSISYVRAIKRARMKNQVFVFVHSHPIDVPEHSRQDDVEEQLLFQTVFNRIENRKVHGSLVISDPEKPVARVWFGNGTYTSVDLIRVIGKRIKLYSHVDNASPFPQFFDRQIRAFGEDIQKTLNKLKVGVVGTGGTGSAVIEQLIRLGVGTLYIFDGQKFELSNINRVYGSRTTDDQTKKVEILTRLANDINLGTIIRSFDSHITYALTAQELKNCDVIFGCTDNHLSRSILCRLALYYYIPVFDMGVKIDSEESQINSIQGRVTTIFPSNSCLFCRNRIKPEMILSESLELGDQNAAQARRREGYAPELPDTAPSVITFTTTIASAAINELLHKLTGYMGYDRESTEIIYLFDQNKIRTNSQPLNEDCFCNDDMYYGRGDVTPFLDTTWRTQ